MTSINEIAEELVKQHTAYGYSPVFFDRGYSDTDDQVLSMFLRGDDTWRDLADIALGDWYHEAVCLYSRELVREYVSKNGNADIDECELEDAIRDYLYEACTQDYELDWVMNMRNPAVRVQVDGLTDPVLAGDGDVTPQILLKQAGIAESEKNITAAQSIIDEALSSHMGSYYNLFLMFQLDLADMKNNGDTVRIVGDAELWATNVYQGDGWSETVEVDITVPRRLMSTDYDAPGYSYCEVFGTSAYYLPEPNVSVFTSQEQTA